MVGVDYRKPCSCVHASTSARVLEDVEEHVAELFGAGLVPWGRDEPTLAGWRLVVERHATRSEGGWRREGGVRVGGVVLPHLWAPAWAVTLHPAAGWSGGWVQKAYDVGAITPSRLVRLNRRFADPELINVLQSTEMLGGKASVIVSRTLLEPDVWGVTRDVESSAMVWVKRQAR